ncbi:hypothetical protein B296_00002969 [Ensete ventricosum]|uniref:PHD finger protein ALFIN-LIKE n=1 Tax=Ensete ventricosum TaxID=4639 RepID=A0A427BAT6_ENSVE|nr:hypothetical protein B296_00002969 [Ensete ventricosum]
METVASLPAPSTVEEVFRDYSGRHCGLVRALTAEVDDLYALCHPERENLCLYGHPDGSWEVNVPPEEVPPEMPEPTLGINFARNGPKRWDWLSRVAMHSDSWLLSVAFFFAARFSGAERKCLFNLINDLPTIFEAFCSHQLTKKNTRVDCGRKPKRSSKVLPTVDNGCDEDANEISVTSCGSCGTKHRSNFWIQCDACERWFHGKCVKMTRAKAEKMKQYRCPSCSSK